MIVSGDMRITFYGTNLVKMFYLKIYTRYSVYINKSLYLYFNILPEMKQLIIYHYIEY